MEDNSDEMNIDFDAKLLRQEHRLYWIILNFWHRAKFSKDDPRYSAVVEALAWRLFMAMLPAAAGLSIAGVSLLAIWFSWEANQLFREQNEYLKIQNDQITKQFDRTERTNLLQALYEKSDVNEPVRGGKANHRIRSDAVTSIVALERKLDDDAPLSFAMALLDEVVVSDVDLHSVDFTLANLRKSTFSRCNMKEAVFCRTKFDFTQFQNVDLRRTDFLPYTNSLPMLIENRKPNPEVVPLADLLIEIGAERPFLISITDCDLRGAVFGGSQLRRMYLDPKATMWDAEKLSAGTCQIHLREGYRITHMENGEILIEKEASE